jgi:hypothetical protein
LRASDTNSKWLVKSDATRIWDLSNQPNQLGSDSAPDIPDNARVSFTGALLGKLVDMPLALRGVVTLPWRPISFAVVNRISCDSTAASIVVVWKKELLGASFSRMIDCRH